MPVVDYSPLEYAVQTVVLVGTDTALPGLTLAQYLSGIDTATIAVRGWYYDECDGYSFKALPTVSWSAGVTEQAILDLYGGDMTPTCAYALNNADADGLINKDSAKRYYSVTSPLGLTGQGGMYGGKSAGTGVVMPHNFPGWMLGGGNSSRLLGGVYAATAVATAPSPATSGTSLVVTSGMGCRFSPTPPFNVRIWAAPTALPTDAGFELATVTARAGDTLTLTRAQGTPARSIVVGDQIRVEQPDDNPWFADEPTEFRGALAHEIGHGLGATYWNPALAQSLPAPYTLNNWLHSGARDGLGLYEALAHPLDAFAGYPTLPDGYQSVMQEWWNWPSVGLLTYEKARLKTSPFMTFHAARPTTLSD